MAKVYEIIDFQRRETGSKELITKLGGQPDWVAIEDWPVSAGWEPKNDFYRPDFSKKEYAWQSAGFDGVSVYDTAGMF